MPRLAIHTFHSVSTILYSSAVEILNIKSNKNKTLAEVVVLYTVAIQIHGYQIAILCMGHIFRCRTFGIIFYEYPNNLISDGTSNSSRTITFKINRIINHATRIIRARFFIVFQWVVD